MIDLVRSLTSHVSIILDLLLIKIDNRLDIDNNNKIIE